MIQGCFIQNSNEYCFSWIFYLNSLQILHGSRPCKGLRNMKHTELGLPVGQTRYLSQLLLGMCWWPLKTLTPIWRITMGKKIWLFMPRRNFGCDVIVRPSVRTYIRTFAPSCKLRWNLAFQARRTFRRQIARPPRLLERKNKNKIAKSFQLNAASTWQRLVLI